MDQNYGTPYAPIDQPNKKKNTTLIIIIVVLVVLCCCVVVCGLAGWYLWNNGDQIFGIPSEVPYLLNHLV
jgi:hypothetical protein